MFFKFIYKRLIYNNTVASSKQRHASLLQKGSIPPKNSRKILFSSNSITAAYDFQYIVSKNFPTHHLIAKPAINKIYLPLKLLDIFLILKPHHYRMYNLI